MSDASDNIRESSVTLLRTIFQCCTCPIFQGSGQGPCPMELVFDRFSSLKTATARGTARLGVLLKCRPQAKDGKSVAVLAVGSCNLGSLVGKNKYCCFKSFSGGG